MEDLASNLKHGARLLAKQPAFTAVAVLVLALGIGANSAMFSLVNAFLFKPLLLRDPGSLVGCFSRSVAKPDAYRAFSYAEYAELRAHNAVFTDLVAHNLSMVGLLQGDTTRRVFADAVSSNYFTTLGVSLYRGRSFTPAEERPGSGIAVAIVSYPFWRRSGADPDLAGKTLRINGRLFTVVGIAPRGFTGTTAMISPELYLPLGMYEAVTNDFEGARLPLADPANRSLILLGRVRAGLAPSTVDSRLAASAAEMAPSGLADERQTYVARPLSRIGVSTSPQGDDELRVPSLLLLFLSGIVLLIASLNIANMMLVRGAARRREIAIRLALGARRGSILTQLFTEGLLLALLGGGAGLLVAAGSTRALAGSLSRLAPIDLVVSAAPDVRVLAATTAFCLVSTLLFALGPAWNLSRPNVAADLKAGQPDGPQRSPRRRLLGRRNLLVIGQLGLSLMLLSTAGLFVRSSLRASHLAPGFRLDHSVIIEVDPGLAGYDPARGRVLLQALTERFRALPGVESAALAATVPFGMVSLGKSVERADDAAGGAGQEGKSGRNDVVSCSYNIVGDGYFATMGIPLRSGRGFGAHEAGGDTPTVAVLDRLAAERLWPHGNALGHSIRLLSGDEARQPQVVEVVGVVDNVQEHLVGQQLTPHVYVPFGPAYQSDMNLHVRLRDGGGAAEARLLATARDEVRAVDARLPVLTARTLRQHVEGSFDVWVMRIAARMFTTFGVVAMLLAAVGLYGVRAFAVARRTREIGIRMAIGASAGDAVRMILREGMLLTAVGAAAGLLLSLGLGRLLAGMLYRVGGWDPLVLAAAVSVLAAASLVACWVPARRAARVPPMASLRNE